MMISISPAPGHRKYPGKLVSNHHPDKVIAVFSGPSLERSLVEHIPGFIWKPPAAQGDVLKTLKIDKPDVIAIIDGYFDGVPSIWHKEILFALSNGVKVYGSSSMGALRAAETDTYGMIGVGLIYQQYRDNVLEDDDEVAVLHAPAELGFKPLSLPMVNVRTTIHKLILKDLICPDIGNRLIDIAKSIFYQHRQWEAIFNIYDKRYEKLPAETDYLVLMEEHYIDQKRNDALELMEQLKTTVTSAAELKTTPEASHDNFKFEWSVMWDKIYHQALNNQNGTGESQFIIDELRLTPDDYTGFLTRVQLKQLALQEAERLRVNVDKNDMARALKNLREKHKLFNRTLIDTWLDSNDLDIKHLDLLLQEEIKTNKIVPKQQEIDRSLLLDELKISGNYVGLKSAAASKKTIVDSDITVPDIKPAMLLNWYFETELNRNIPADIDLYISSIGLNNRTQFYQLLNRHYQFQLANQKEKP